MAGFNPATQPPLCSIPLPVETAREIIKSLELITKLSNNFQFVERAHYMRDILDRENLRADLQRMIDINTRQGQMINELLAAKGCDEPFIESEYHELKSAKIDVGNHYISMWSASQEYKVGDRIVIDHHADLSWNGTYVLGDDRVFRKVSDDVNESK